MKITGMAVDSLRVRGGGGVGVQISRRVFRVPTEETEKNLYCWKLIERK